jgi:UDP-N-acetylmuramoyl-tripeptide--D-alanyl-D-alanine ligase
VTVLWTSDDAIAALDGTAEGGDWRATGISIDSRTVAKGDLFFAITGPRFDGHAFVASALTNGAVAAVVSRRPDDLPEDAPIVIVDDTLKALERLGMAARARTGARVVAVTGSVGKTGVKETLKLVLSAYGRTHASPGSFNNHWGLPLTLARMPRETEYAVLELGMNHSGELTPLSRMARPHVAIITTIASTHIGNFASLDEIADAKAEILTGVEPGGAAVLNRDNEYFGRLAQAAADAGIGKIIGFGHDAGAEARMLASRLDPDGCHVDAEILGKPVSWDIGCAGAHWAQNSLGVMSVLAALELDPAPAVAALAGMTPPKGRGERHLIPFRGGEITLIDDSYNASPVSMRAAFDVLAGADTGTGGRRIAVLGDMLELGATAEEEHRSLADEIAGRDIDLLYSCGPMMRACSRALPEGRRGGHEADSTALAPRLLAALEPGDTILVKGSFGSRMTVIVNALLNLNVPLAANGS